MSILSLNAKLDRTDPSTPWGFRMHGGKDFGCPLTIQRVTPGSLAANCGLQVGDAIVKIGDNPTEGLLHKDAQQTILRYRNGLELTLQRGGAGGLSRASKPEPAAPAPAPSAFSAVPQSGGQAPYQQNYGSGPKPYGVDNVSAQTANMNLGSSSPSAGAAPPWQSQSQQPTFKNPSRPAAAAAPAAPAAPAARPGSWQPKVPTGPRTPKFGKMGDARHMPAPSAAGRLAICNNCGNTIRGPFVSALDKTWCPDHFTCANPQCGTHLLDCGFVEEGGQLFCERDYEQYFAPRCAKCGRAIVGEVVNALKNTYHTQCFLCCHCRQPIGSGSFHIEDGNNYCETDWAALFQTKCYGCQFPIEPGDRWVEALSQNWHSECFNCSTCQVNLEGQSFFAKAGKPYCKKHAGNR